MSRDLYMYLLKNYDPDNSCIKLEEGGFMSIYSTDVHSILGIPFGVPNIPINVQFYDAEWIDEGGYFDTGGIHDDLLFEKVVNLKASDEFKRAFVLFACSTLLSLTGRNTCYWGLLKSVDNVNDISTYNWCGYVRNCLLRTMKPRTNGKLKKSYGGCLMFLQRLYMMHCETQYRGYPAGDIKALDFWTTDFFRSRVRWELGNGGFGRGQLALLKVKTCRRSSGDDGAAEDSSASSLSDSLMFEYDDYECSDSEMEVCIKKVKMDIALTEFNVRNSKRSLRKLLTSLKKRGIREKAKLCGENNGHDSSICGECEDDNRGGKDRDVEPVEKAIEDNSRGGKDCTMNDENDDEDCSSGDEIVSKGSGSDNSEDEWHGSEESNETSDYEYNDAEGEKNEGFFSIKQEVVVSAEEKK
ncbi:uncharacterized protein LOC132300209 [Cornus florida]|uniref:uncharacterized protein LOC132300209 n=1 Tax=Cornus florida TaxID=4283 RepID=UPI00289C35BD|nr:uncharacterized protein LOC132300209 [Cornus florida]XP_059653183.1 uncharacterized protein LOC132300209 [Cornus florida]XP_059653184.1 uncharacterized protein LOC132300209 [Cornus florida]XP_059653185.1 uncharacterized protein LOC132300209 [Cornus florida]